MFYSASIKSPLCLQVHLRAATQPSPILPSPHSLVLPHSRSPHLRPTPSIPSLPSPTPTFRDRRSTMPLAVGIGLFWRQVANTATLAPCSAPQRRRLPWEAPETTPPRADPRTETKRHDHGDTETPAPHRDTVNKQRRPVPVGYPTGGMLDTKLGDYAARYKRSTGRQALKCEGTCGRTL